jgi:hypothetical protein
VTTPARDALDESMCFERHISPSAIRRRILANPSLVLAALVEAHGLDEVLRMAKGLPPIVPDPRCSYTFPLPSWAGEDQMDPCRCRLDVEHDGEHWCEHLDDPDPRTKEATDD